MKKVVALIFGLFLSTFCFAKGMNDSVTLKKGIAAIEYVPYNGGVFLYAENINKKYVPLIDTVDYAASSFIGVAVDKTYYNLRDSGGVTYTYAIEDNALTITYNIKKKIELNVVYTITKKDVINIRYNVKNLDAVKHSVSVKSVFDTILGEGKGGAYLTAAKNKINSEYIISDFAKHKYVTSTDGKLAIRFLFDDVYQRCAYKTVIAAKPFFDSTVFEGRFVEGRGFNTVLSYNNSCVGCFFKTLKLNPAEEKFVEQKLQVLRNEFAISEGEDDDGFDEALNGDEQYYAKTEIKSADDLIEEKHSFSDLSEDGSVDFAKSDFEVTEDKDDEKAQPENQILPVIESKPEVENTVSEKVYTKQYAKELIEKINALNDNGDDVSPEELAKLQIELENVLKYLKNK